MKAGRKSFVLYVPVVGLIVALVRHSRACRQHKLACVTYWKQNDVLRDEGTWHAFDHVFAELENVSIGLTSFFVGLVSFILGGLIWGMLIR
jgi:hypothetical protein